MISTNNFRTGLTIEIDGEIFTVIEFQHVKQGRGSAFVRTKLKNIQTGNVFEKTFRAGEKVARAHLDRKKMQYLYQTGELYYFMDTETYEQVPVSEELVGDNKKFLKENMEVSVLFHNNTPIGIELPNFVELKVTQTEPGFKGDTATGGTKPAVVETGAKLQVPLFIELGDTIKIDTRTGEYISRV
jgi:elongation factor P